MASPGNLTITDLATGTRATDALRSGARRLDPAAIREVARQFEAMFLREVLRDMRAGSLADDVLGSSEGDMYQQMFDAQMASALSRGGGLGLARMLERQLLEHAARMPQGADASKPGDQPPATPNATPAVGVPLPERAPQAVHREAPRAPAGAAAPLESAESFVERLLPHARWAAGQLGVSPAAIIAQAALETAWGRRMPRTADGRPSHNLFGIKAGASWSGASASAQTLEYADGVAVRGRAEFRAYDSIEDGVRDYVAVLSRNPRFRQALSAGTDALGFVAGLARSGYATDPSYAQKLKAVLASPLLRVLAP